MNINFNSQSLTERISGFLSDTERNASTEIPVLVTPGLVVEGVEEIFSKLGGGGGGGGGAGADVDSRKLSWTHTQRY